MSVSVCWDNDEHTVVLFTFVGKWTWEEYLDACYESNALHMSVSHKVYSIADLTQSDQIPFGANSYALKTLRIAPSNAGTRVAVSGGTLLEIIINIFKRLHLQDRDAFDTAPSLEAARNKLKQRIEDDKTRQ